MTVTWPITPNSTLDPATKPVPFIVQRDVTAVSVSFGSRRVEERAYRDGVFVWPYLRSTRDGNTFTLVRDDGERGWPADPKPFVDEEPEPPMGGMPWGAIYTLDFAAQPSQSLNAVGAHVIDGLTWWAKNAISDSDLNIVEGEGLNWSCWNTGLGAGRVLCLPLANVPGFNASAPVQVWFNMLNTGSMTEGIVAGVIDAPANAADYTASNPDGAFWLTPSGSSTQWFVSRHSGNNNFGGPDHGATWETTAFGAFVMTAWTDCALIDITYAGAALPPGVVFDYAPWHVTGRAQKRTSPCVALSSMYRANARIRKISVVQPQVPA